MAYFGSGGAHLDEDVAEFSVPEGIKGIGRFGELAFLDGLVNLLDRLVQLDEDPQLGEALLPAQAPPISRNKVRVVGEVAEDELACVPDLVAETTLKMAA